MKDVPADRSSTLSLKLRHRSQSLSRKLRTAGKIASGLPLSAFRPGNVAMFHIGRSGSTVLTNLLNQHPGIFWDGEIYEPSRLGPRAREIVMEKGILAVDPVKLLRRRMLRAGKSFYGFEVKFFHIKLAGMGLPEYVERLAGRGITHFVVLERRNYLKKIVSSVAAHNAARFHQASQAKTMLNRVHLDVDNVRIDYDAKPLADYLEDYRENFRKLKGLLANQSMLWLTYEDDILENPLEGYGRVCDFLGVGRRPVSIRFSKTNPFTLSEILTNFDEVESALRGTHFEWMLHK